MTSNGLTVFVSSPETVARLRELAGEVFETDHLSSGRVFYRADNVRLFPMRNLPNRVFRLTGATYQTVLDAIRTQGGGDGA